MADAVEGRMKLAIEKAMNEVDVAVKRSEEWGPCGQIRIDICFTDAYNLVKALPDGPQKRKLRAYFRKGPPLCHYEKRSFEKCGRDPEVERMKSRELFSRMD